MSESTSLGDLVAGIDEAGRGPLIGDLFIAMVVIDEKRLPLLEKAGVRDSKKLSRSRREELFTLILSTSAGVFVARVTPDQIDTSNITELEIEAITRLLSRATKIFTLTEVYIDAFTQPHRITHSIDNAGIPASKIRAECGADAKYVAVAAASIVAKVLRDRYVDQLKVVYGDFGSGYPSDWKTIEWLKRYYTSHGSLPPIVRRSWRTVERVLGLRPAAGGAASKTLDKYFKGRGGP